MRLSLIKNAAGGGGGGTVTGAANGLHLDGTVIKMGGPLTELTTISGPTSTEQILFTGFSVANLGTFQDAFFQIEAADGGTGGPIALGISNPLGTGIFVQGGDTGINIDGNSTPLNTGIVINGATTGGNITANTTGLNVFGDATGMTVGATTGYAVDAQSGAQAVVRVFSHLQTITPTEAPIIIQRDGNLPVSPIESMMIIRRSTNSIVPTNTGICIDMQCALVGSQIANTTRIVSKVINTNVTTQTEIWGMNVNAAVQMFTISASSGGKFGFGSTVTAPTARLHLPAGVTNPQNAPLKFTAGTLMTTPENGAVEFEGTHYYGTIGTTRFQFDQQLLAANSGIRLPYSAKTATYNITTSDYTIDCNGTFTVTLPTAVGITGQIYNIINSGAGTITLATTSSQTIGNTTSDPTSITVNPGTNVMVQGTGANWRIL